MRKQTEEKRKYSRIDLHAALRYQILGTAQSYNAVSQNISVLGLSFVCDNFIAPLTPLRLEINLLSRVLRPIGQIAWASPLPHSNRNRLGIEFLEIDPIEKNYLKDYISMQMGEF